MIFRSERVETTFFRFTHRNTFHDYLPALAGSARVRVLLHAHVIEIETAKHAQCVSGLRLRVQAKALAVSARLFILACGGIENARLLLLSHRTYADGLGNGNDLVGRFFMDHIVVFSGMVVPRSHDFYQQVSLYKRQRVDGVPRLGALKLSDAVTRDEQLLSVILSPIVGRAAIFSHSFFALRSLLQVRNLTRPRRVASLLFGVARDPAPAALACALRLRRAELAQTDFFGIHAHVEQPPRPDNRVTLSEARDELGLRRAHLAWRLDTAEEHAIRRTHEIISEELRAAGIGSMKFRYMGRDLEHSLVVTHHHMGTTRMHHDPAHGVVDENCRVHGISNLFIAGSSVSPTGGPASVTFTLVALAIRLADHIKALVRRQAPAS